MAQFEAKGNRIYQLPTDNQMGFLVCECDTGDGNTENNAYNAWEIVKALNATEAKSIIKGLLRYADGHELRGKQAEELAALCDRANEFIRDNI